MYKNLIRYGFTAFALVVVLLLSACSEKNISGKYVSLWGGILYFDFQDGNYTTGDDDDFGTYIVDKDSVVLTPSDNDTRDIMGIREYKFSDSYLLANSFSGTIPDEDFFNAFCEWEDFDYKEKIQFYNDGTFSRGFTALGINLDDMNGTYERKGEVITLTTDDGSTHGMLILDNTLYDAYKKEKVSQH